MGFFSSLFGSTRSSQPTSTVVQATKIPEEVSPYLKEVLKGYQDLYRGQLDRGYQEYGGQTIAPLTAAQESALTGLEGLRGATQPMYETAAQRATGAGESFTPEAAQQYMSPYQQAVTDIELREAQRKFEGDVLPRLEAQAVQQGAMSGLGSRAGVEMAEAQRSQTQQLADIQAKGQQRAFEAARKQFEAERARERLVGQDLSALANQALTSEITQIGAQKAAGEERQQLGQTALDEAYKRYLERESFPESTLATYSGGLYGNPLASTFDQTKTTYGAQPSTGQSLLQLGLSGLGMYGMGKNIFKSKDGGYINDKGLTTVYRQNNAQVGTGDDNRLAIWDTISGVGDYIKKALEVSPEQKKRIQLQNAIDLQRNPSLALMGPAPVNPSQLVSPKVANVMDQIAQANKGRLDLTETVDEKKVREPLVADLKNKLTETIADESEQLRIDHGPTYTDEEKTEISEYWRSQDPTAPVSLKQDVTVKETITADKGTPKTKTKKTSLTDTNVLDAYIKQNDKLKDMVGNKIKSMNDLQTQLKEKIKADESNTKDSRSRRNELAFWRSFLIVGAADPSKGFMNALAKGATAGGKSFADTRMKLLEEAKGDGKKAIDAIKTLMVAETADLKLQQISTTSSGEVAKVLAAWAKANNLKNQSVKKYAEITKWATQVAKEAMAPQSEGYDDYVKLLTIEGVTHLDKFNDLGGALSSMARVPKPTTEVKQNTKGSERKPASNVKRIGNFQPPR